jgi:ATP-dependent helicase HrpB
VALGACLAAWSPASALGQRMAGLPTHPRLARLLCDAQDRDQPGLGAALAAVIGERDLRLPPPRGVEPRPAPAAADAIDRLGCLERARQRRFDAGLRDEGIDPNAAREVARAAEDLQQAIVRSSESLRNAESPSPQHTDVSTASPTRRPDDRTTGRPDEVVVRLLLAAYPDRVAVRAAPDANRGMMMGGIAVEIEAASAVAARKGYPRPPLFLATVVQGTGHGLATINHVRQAAELSEEDLHAVFPGVLRRQERLAWDEARGRVEAQAGWYWHSLAVRIERGAQADPAQVAVFLASRLAPEAEALILADEAAGSLLLRLRWLAAACPDLGLDPPDPAGLAQLIADCCTGCRTRDEVAAKPKRDWLAALIGYDAVRRVEDLAPATITVPTGNHIRLDYSTARADHPPVLAVRLQELFGQATTPTVAGGRIGVLLHLLGPNYRCEQVTRDLASFWANTYPQVRKDLRGRYPKHSWPDDPLAALPVARGRPRQG